MLRSSIIIHPQTNLSKLCLTLKTDPCGCDYSLIIYSPCKQMAPIKTYVFLYLEANTRIKGTDVPAITELGMLAVKRRHFLENNLTNELNIDKFLMNFYPLKPCTNKNINIELFKTINSYIDSLEKPVCLIAHDGFKNHFKVVKSHFQEVGKQFTADFKCGDSLYAFYDLLEEEKWAEDIAAAEAINEREKSFEDLNRPIFFAPNDAPADSYDLHEIFQRDIGPLFSHLVTNRAEKHCNMMLQIAQKRAQRFCRWIDVNYCPFSEVPTD